MADERARRRNGGATPSDQLRGQLDRGSALVINLFLLTVFCAFAFVFAGTAIEMVAQDGVSTRSHFFHFLADFSTAFGSSWSTVAQAILTIIGLYFVRGINVRSWYVLTGAAMVTMVAGSYLAMTLRADRFYAVFSQSNWLAENIEAAIVRSRENSGVEVGTATTYLSRISNFVWLAVGSNFAFFLAMLKRDKSHAIVRKVLEQLGIVSDKGRQPPAPDAAGEARNLPPADGESGAPT